MNPNWEKITSLAYFELINLEIHSFPIEIDKLHYDNIIIVSYQTYAQLANCSLESVSLNGKLDDAYVVKEHPALPSSTSLILYDEQHITPRMKHSLLHEIGHIRCNHSSLIPSDRREIEAHFFAAQMNVPNVIVKAIAERGYSISTESLSKYFGISFMSADKKTEYLRKHSFEHQNEYDGIILQQFSDYLNTYFPPKNSYHLDEYYADLEESRREWY